MNTYSHNLPSLAQTDLLSEYSQELLEQITENFYQELLKATYAFEKHKENSSSLPFIVSEITKPATIAEGKPFQVFVMGGTMGKKALCKRIDGAIEIISKEEKEIPVLATGKDFFVYMDNLLDEKVDTLLINFAYPIAPVVRENYPDGVLIEPFGEKTFRAKDLLGKKIGEELEKYFFSKRKKKIKVIVINDTICLLLSGKKKSVKNIGCGIVGTGLNFGFALSDTAMVNIESAEFDNFVPSPAGEFLKNQQLGSPFGRETNGGLLYHHFNQALKLLQIDFPPISSTIQLQIIAEQESETVSKLARTVLTRSAQLVACQAAGIAKVKKGNMKFVMEGGLFWGESSYKKTVEKTVAVLVPDYKVSFVKVYESGILGAAKILL